MGNPTFLFIPGAWHIPAAYGPVQSILEGDGFECVTVSLPSVGCKPVTYDFTEDVEAIRSAVLKLVEGGKEVIVVMPSTAECVDLKL
jgi:hypothetical protein